MFGIKVALHQHLVDLQVEHWLHKWYKKLGKGGKDKGKDGKSDKIRTKMIKMLQIQT